MRKIIQIAVTQSSGTPVEYALCDDGTLWQCNINYEWRQLPPIPKDEPKELTDVK